MVKLIVVEIKFSACVKPTLGSVLTQELKIRQSNTVIFFYSISLPILIYKHLQVPGLHSIISR